MLAAAMEDGVMSASELEAAAVEAVECTIRAGFDASLGYFDPETGGAGFGVPAGGPDAPMDDPGSLALEGCTAAYFTPAQDAFTATSGPSEEEARKKLERQQQAELDCLNEAGYRFDTHDDYFFSDIDLPEGLSIECARRAYFE